MYSVAISSVAPYVIWHPENSHFKEMVKKKKKIPKSFVLFKKKKVFHIRKRPNLNLLMLYYLVFPQLQSNSTHDQLPMFSFLSFANEDRCAL